MSAFFRAIFVIILLIVIGVGLLYAFHYARINGWFSKAEEINTTPVIEGLERGAREAGDAVSHGLEETGEALSRGVDELRDGDHDYDQHADVDLRDHQWLAGANDSALSRDFLEVCAPVSNESYARGHHVLIDAHIGSYGDSDLPITFAANTPYVAFAVGEAERDHGEVSTWYGALDSRMEMTTGASVIIFSAMDAAFYGERFELVDGEVHDQQGPGDVARFEVPCRSPQDGIEILQRAY